MSEGGMSRRDWIAVALVTLLGALLRSVAIGREALWTDEALTYVLAQAPPWALASAPIDPTAPLYYWLHQALIPDGASATVGRLISLIAGILTVPAAYFLGRSMSGGGAGLFVAAWVAVSAPLVDYSQEARAYALLVLLVTLSALALHRTARTGSTGALAAFVGTALLALYTHFIALFWVGPAMLILLFAARRSGKHGAEPRAALACALIAVGFVPELLRAWRYATENNGFTWLEQPGPAALVELVASQWFAAPWPVLSLAALTALLILVAWRQQSLGAWGRGDPVAAMILAVLLVQPIALWLFGYLVLPVVMPRTVLPSLPAVGLLIALLVAALPKRTALTVGLTVTAAATAATVAGGFVRPKEPWGMTRAVLGETRAGRELIVACPYWKVPALLAATRGLGAAPLATPSGAGMRLIEHSLGADSAWDQLYHRRVDRSVIAQPLGQERPRQIPIQVWAQALFVVTSECHDQDRAAIAAWAGTFQVTRRWTAPARGEHQGIVVERWVLARPRNVVLLLVP